MLHKKSLTKNEEQTWKYYEKHAKEYTARRNTDVNFWKPEIERFHSLLPTGKILEIGSGGGHEAVQLIKLGYDYTGTDISTNLIKIAKKDNKTGTFLHRSVYDLSFPDYSFDGFWTAATLLHIPKIRIKEVLRKIHTVIKPGGIGFISLGLGNNEEIEKSTGRLISLYRLNEFSKILNETDFTVLETNVIDENVRNNNSSRDQWVTYFVKA